MRLAVPAVLIGGLFWAFGPEDIAGRVAGLDASWLSLAVLLLLSQTILMACRWRLVAHCLGLRFGAVWAVREYLLAQTLNLTLPGGVVGDAARAVRSRGTAGWKVATQAVVVERAAGQAGLLAVGLIGLSWSLADTEGLAWSPALLRGLATATAVATVGGVFAAWAFRRGTVARLLRACLPTRRIAGAQVVLSLGAALLNVAAFSACARATGTVLGPQATLLLVPLILTAMLIPLSVAGWGWREGAAAVLFPIGGASAQAGISAGIVFGMAMLLSVVPVAIAWVWPVEEATR